MNDFFDNLVRAGVGILPPLANSIANGNSATDTALVAERNFFNQLNGSGAPDGAAALDATSGTRELNNPRSFAFSDVVSGISGGSAINKVLWIAVIVLVAVLAFRIVKRLI